MRNVTRAIAVLSVDRVYTETVPIVGRTQRPLSKFETKLGRANAFARKMVDTPVGVPRTFQRQIVATSALYSARVLCAFSQ